MHKRHLAVISIASVPRKSPVTVEKLAINAVMAGCKPEYFPVVLALVECLLEPGLELPWRLRLWRRRENAAFVTARPRWRVGLVCITIASEYSLLTP